MADRQATWQFGPALAVVADEDVSHLMFELLLLTDISAAENVARDDLCRRIRRRDSSVSEAIQVSLEMTVAGPRFVQEGLDQVESRTPRGQHPCLRHHLVVLVRGA